MAWRFKGTPPGPKPSAAIPRILARTTFEPERGCWISSYPKSKGGYTRIKWNGRLHMCHRVTYEHYRGPIPDGLDLDHLCRNTACCNPLHLEPVTRRENVRRSNAPNARPLRDGVCKRGHPVENMRTDPRTGNRSCRVCNALRARGHRKNNQEVVL